MTLDPDGPPAGGCRQEVLSTRAAVRLAVRPRDDLSEITQQVVAGEATLEHLQAAAHGTAGLDPALVAQAQPAIAALVRVAEPAVVRKQLREHAEAIDPELGREVARRAHARRGLFARQLDGVGVVLDGSLDLEHGATLLLALDAQARADGLNSPAGDPLSLAARRADALVGWAQNALTSLRCDRPVAVQHPERDRHCVIRGCRRRPSGCQAHHVRHWADGGPTDLDNLVLLCDAHHRELHEGHDLPTHDGRTLTGDGWARPTVTSSPRGARPPVTSGRTSHHDLSPRGQRLPSRSLLHREDPCSAPPGASAPPSRPAPPSRSRSSWA